jgi:hypothetical protein
VQIHEVSFQLDYQQHSTSGMEGQEIYRSALAPDRKGNLRHRLPSRIAVESACDGLVHGSVTTAQHSI